MRILIMQGNQRKRNDAALSPGLHWPLNTKIQITKVVIPILRTSYLREKNSFRHLCFVDYFN